MDDFTYQHGYKGSDHVPICTVSSRGGCQTVQGKQPQKEQCYTSNSKCDQVEGLVGLHAKPTALPAVSYQS